MIKVQFWYICGQVYLNLQKRNNSQKIQHNLLMWEIPFLLSHTHIFLHCLISAILDTVVCQSRIQHQHSVKNLTVVFHMCENESNSSKYNAKLGYPGYGSLKKTTTSEWCKFLQGLGDLAAVVVPFPLSPYFPYEDWISSKVIAFEKFPPGNFSVHLYSSYYEIGWTETEWKGRKRS